MKGSSRYELKDVIVGYDRTMNNSDNEQNSGKSSTVDSPGAWPRIGVRLERGGKTQAFKSTHV